MSVSPLGWIALIAVVAGLVLILAVIGGWLYEIASGRSGNPFGWLAAVAGVAYILAVAFLRSRS